MHKWACRSEIGVGLFSSDFDESDDPGQVLQQRYDLVVY
jgi:hypothetical protein